jgi:hypothetical protein
LVEKWQVMMLTLVRAKISWCWVICISYKTISNNIIQNIRLISCLGSATSKMFNIHFLSSPTTWPRRG